MNSLPYIVPEKEMGLVLGKFLMIISVLGKTKRGKWVINVEKIQIFTYLITNPVVLNKVLLYLNKDGVEVTEKEFFSVKTISQNIDSLFDLKLVKNLLKVSASKKFLEIKYDKVNGFVFYLSEEGLKAVDSFEGDYFLRINRYLNTMMPLQTESVSKINNAISAVLSGYNK